MGNNNKPTAVIVDVDGTVADCSHRRGLLKKQKDWKKGFENPELVAKDTPIKPVINTVIGLSERYEILFVTARHEALREVTANWLRLHGLEGISSALYMRADGDNRKDVEVKREILATIKNHYNPIMAIDDRSSVVAMWREEGLICLQCAEGDF